MGARNVARRQLSAMRTAGSGDLQRDFSQGAGPRRAASGQLQESSALPALLTPALCQLSAVIARRQDRADGAYGDVQHP